MCNRHYATRRCYTITLKFFIAFLQKRRSQLRDVHLQLRNECRTKSQALVKMTNQSSMKEVSFIVVTCDGFFSWITVSYLLFSQFPGSFNDMQACRDLLRERMNESRKEMDAVKERIVTLKQVLEDDVRARNNASRAETINQIIERRRALLPNTHQQPSGEQYCTLMFMCFTPYPNFSFSCDRHIYTEYAP